MESRVFRSIVGFVLLSSLAALLTTGTPPTAAQGQPPVLAPDRARVAEALRSSPIMFIENVGQFDTSARFQVRGAMGGTMWLARDAIWMTVLEQPGKEARGPGDKEMINVSPPHPVSLSPQRGVNLKLSFVGANPHPRLEPFDRLDTVVSYFIGSDPDQWRPNVPVWGGVRYAELYPGIDLVVGAGFAPAQGRPQASSLPWRLEVRDGADLSAVRLRVEGAGALALDGDRLRLTTAVGEFSLPLLAVEGTTSDVQPATLELSSVESFNLERGTFEVASPLLHRSIESAIHNPQSSDLLYATFLGGSDDDQGRAIAMDGSGNAYVTGWTGSSNFPTTPGAFDTNHNGYDVFVVKLNASGTALAYATFLGGNDNDAGGTIAVDRAGSAYVAGVTYSSDFPTTPDAFDTSYDGYDAFVVKLNISGTGLAYATSLGGSGYEAGQAIAVDGAGSAYVTGWTGSSSFPTTPGAFDTSYNGGTDAFVVKLNVSGTTLAYAIFLGGSDDDWGWAIAVDGAGSAYVTGETASSNFPTAPGAFDERHNGGDYDAFVVKLNVSGTALAYATFLGGSDWDAGEAIAVGEAGSAYVTGWTRSSNFPATPGAFDTSYNGGTDAFVVKLNVSGTTLAYATFLGGSYSDGGWAIVVDGAGSAYVTGDTASSNFPTTPGAFDTACNGDWDAFVVKLNAAGSGLAYATFLGGSSSDRGWAIAVDGVGNAYVTGKTWSSDFPTTPGAFDRTYNGSSYDAFVAKLAVGGALTYSISGRVHDGSGNPIPGVTISDGAGHTATTDSNGNYTLSGLAARTYTITPVKSGYTFSPASRTVIVPPDATGQDFTAMLITYSISGRVTDVNNNPVPGITISDGAGYATITDGNGNYILSGLASGTYTLTPSKGAEWTFKPSSHTVSVPPDATGKDFTGYDKPPIVFVHGWGGFPPWGPCEWPDPDEYFQSIDDYLWAAGYYVAYARLETSPCYTPPLIENVPCLLNAIALAKTATNQRQVILIAHSMGGLVSRAYIEGPDYDEDVAALFTFGSPHQGVPTYALVWLFNGATLGQVCKDYQPVVCDFSTLGMILFNHDHPTRTAGVTYHVISGDAPFSPREPIAKVLYGPLPGPDDGLVQTSSGTGLSGILDRFVTDETHGPGSGPRSYFIRDDGPSTSYMQCLEPVLVDRTSTACGSVGPSQIAVQAISDLPGHTPLEHGTLLAGQTVTRTISLEGGPTLFAAQWQTGTLTVILVDPNGQVIDPAYAASHPEVVTYDAEATVATYHFPDALAGKWQLVLEGGDDIPPEGSVYVTFAAFESALRLTGGTDRNWYTPGAAATITASLSGPPASAVVTATILYADGTSETVELWPQGGDEHQATHTVPNVPGYVEVRLVATGTTADQIPFERGTSLVFQISSGRVALSGVYSDAPQPRSAGSSLYQALLVTAGIEAALGGEVGLSADLVDAEGQFVAHALTIEEVAAGSGSLTLRFDGDDIYASQRSGPYTLTNLLLTDHRGVPLVLAEAEDVYTTATYDYRSFDREKIYLSLVLRNR